MFALDYNCIRRFEFSRTSMSCSGAEISHKRCEGFWSVCTILSWYPYRRTSKLKPSVRLGVMRKFFYWPDIQVNSRLLHYHLVMAGHFINLIARRETWKLHWPCKNLLQFTFTCFNLVCSSSDSYIAILGPGLVSFLFYFDFLCCSGNEYCCDRIKVIYTTQSKSHLSCSLVLCTRGLPGALVVLVHRAENSSWSWIHSSRWFTPVV